MAPREAVVRQGDVFWVRFTSAGGSEPWGRRPALVLGVDHYRRWKRVALEELLKTLPRHRFALAAAI
jgi:mRNA-degrading endonuclease toxin of MazEF toxin-antitoxin module